MQPLLPEVLSHSLVFPIKSRVGAGAIHFGMTKNQVRSVLCFPPTLSVQEKQGLGSDVFEELGIRVVYAEAAGCVAIEFKAPAQPEFCWRRLLTAPAAHIEVWLRSADHAVARDGEWIVSPKFALALRVNSVNRRQRFSADSVVTFADGFRYSDMQFQGCLAGP
jgi:hypothetical protein